MFQEIKFESDRLVAKPLDRKDAESLLKIYSDKEAMKFRGSGPMKNIDDAFQMIKEQEIKSNQNTKTRFGLLDKINHQLIGTLLLIRNENQTNCEVGFSFHKEYWGKGFGRETLKMVEQSLRNSKSIEEISAWCIKENIAAVRIFQKAGYSEIQQNDYPLSYLFKKRLKNDTTTTHIAYGG